MKAPLTIALLTLSAGLICADAAIPTAFSKERYAETEETSPFVLETKVDNTPPPAPKDSAFKNMVLTGIGTDYVTIKHIGDDLAMRFYGNKPNDDQISVKEVHAADKPSECYVVLRKGDEEGQVKYDENYGRNAVAAAVNPAQAPRPPGGGVGGVPQPRTALPPIVQGVVPKAPSPATQNIPRPTQPGVQVPRPTGGGTGFRGGPPGGASLQPPANGVQPGGNTGAPRIRVRNVNNR
jgi:hypothetical protein